MKNHTPRIIAALVAPAPRSRRLLSVTSPIVRAVLQRLVPVTAVRAADETAESICNIKHRDGQRICGSIVGRTVPTNH